MTKSSNISRLSHLTKEEITVFYNDWKNGEASRSLSARISEKLGFGVSKNLVLKHFKRGIEEHVHVPVTESDIKLYKDFDKRAEERYHNKKRITAQKAAERRKNNKVAEVMYVERPGPARKHRIVEDSNVLFAPNKGPQTRFLAAPEEDVLFGGAAGGGKVVRKGDVVSTPFGWRAVEDLKVGSLISNPEGGVQKVVQLHPWQSFKPTTVWFSDGTKIDVHEEHLWQAWRGSKRNGERVFGFDSREVVETAKLREWLDAGYTPQIPVTQPVVYNTVTREKNKITPYLIGVLLGDGCITTKQITITAHQDDQNHLSAHLPYGDDVVYKGQTIRFRGETRKWLVEKLQLHSLLGTNSHTKFIPNSYKYAPIKDRWELVRGLMDTDGYSAPDKNGSYFTSVSKRLARDMAEVLRSLGCVVSVYTKDGKHRDKDGEVVECSLVYELYIKSRDDSALFNMERKKTHRIEKEISKAVVKVEMQEDVVEGRCITVSSPSGLYITNDYIVTHNSVALIVDPLRYIDKSGHRVLIMRRTFRELRQLIDLSRQLYTQAFSGAKYKEGDKVWTFPSGAKIEFGYLEKEGDVYQYQGNDYTYIAFDELTQLPTEFPWAYLFSRLRTPDPSIITYARASANPGGVGNDWVRKRYVEPATPGEPFTGPDGLSRRFIPSFLSDNPYLTQDGKYEKMLQSLPATERKRLLEGDWYAVEGSAFPEFRMDVHVVDSYDIPKSWKRFRAIDYGYSAPSCCLWMAMSPEDGTIIVYRELYEKGLTAERLAEKILDLEMEDMPMNGVVDGAVFNRVGYTNTVGQILNSYGLKLRSANKDRKAGKQQIHSRLAYREGKRPGVQLFKSCPNLIREMQGIPLSKKDPEDVDTSASDHAYDAFRYGLMSVPALPTRQELFYDAKRTVYSSDYRPSDPFFGY
jgi:hypothetical protein